MQGDFWDHWETGVGFNKTDWLQAYLADRLARPLTKAKKSRPPISNTRRCLGWIEEGATGVSILETNIFARPTATKAELALKYQNSVPFRFLCEAVRPKIIVAHGVDAQIAVELIDTSAKIIKVPHLSRGWSKERARDLGRSLAALRLPPDSSKLHRVTKSPDPMNMPAVPSSYTSGNDRPVRNRAVAIADSQGHSETSDRPDAFDTSPANLLVWQRIQSIGKRSGLDLRIGISQYSLRGAPDHSNTDRIFRHKFTSRKADIRVREDVFGYFPEIGELAPWNVRNIAFRDLRTDDLEVLRRILDALEAVAKKLSP